jgi:diketogulonate reductase-like aldo/keto reductase
MLRAMPVATRREFLTLLGASGALVSTAARIGAAELMPTRPIPSTGELLPVIGLGSTKPVTEIATRGAERVETVIRTLVEHGGRVVDTWPRNAANDAAFGRIIDAPDLRDRLFVTLNLEQEGREAGREHFDRTLALYRRETIDLVGVGSLTDLDTRWPELRAWKEAGRARYIGVTAARAELYDRLEAFLAREKPDFVEINYSITERETEHRFLPRLADRGIATLISRPFMNGTYFERLADVPLPAWTADFGCSSWAQFSLQYILANPAVTCVLTETTSAAHMAENALAALAPLPSEAARARMRAYLDAL